MPKLSALTICFVLFFSFASLASFAQAVTSPRPASPAATISQTIGISTVTVNYSRPAVKGREIWGALVPYGWNVQAFGAGNQAPWRAGANENTVIKFSHPAMVEGQAVPAGSYGLFFVINKDNSGELILSKEYRSWGSFFYDPKQDFMRVKIQLREIPQTEVLTYNFSNASRTSAELVLDWEKKEFPVKIEFAVDDIVIANATQELKGPTGFNWLGYFSAANYTLQNKVNFEQGLAWIDKAIIMNNTFLTLNVKAGILKETGKTAEADKIMTDAVKIATEAELNQYAYQVMNGGQQDKAIELFVLNTQRHPASPNAWDSLGEGYALKGDKKNAVASFKKSLSMNPPANVKENSEKYLKKLGAM
jgi:tetratricopeptide (TPR) repeat protein